MPNLKMVVIQAEVDEPAVLKCARADLDALQAAVGGYVEAVSGDGWTAYCNEEGKVEGLPVNLRATVVAGALGWNTGDVLNGTVVFLGPADEEGEDTDVGDAVLAAVARIGFRLVKL